MSYSPNVAHLARCGVEGGWQWSGFFFPHFPPLKPRYVLQSGASYSPKNTVNVGPFGLRLCVIFFLIFFISLYCCSVFWEVFLIYFFQLIYCILNVCIHIFITNCFLPWWLAPCSRQWTDLRYLFVAFS